MFENPRRGRQARNFTQNVPKILDLKSSRSRYDFWPNCTPLSPNTIIYHGNVSLRILSFCIFNFLIPIYLMEKWPWQMARPMFSKDMTAYALGYTFFFTLIWSLIVPRPLESGYFWNHLLFFTWILLSSHTKTSKFTHLSGPIRMIHCAV